MVRFGGSSKLRVATITWLRLVVHQSLEKLKLQGHQVKGKDLGDRVGVIRVINWVGEALGLYPLSWSNSRPIIVKQPSNNRQINQSQTQGFLIAI